MKTRIISMLVLAGMIVGANSALASRARVNVMGQGENGFIFNGSGSMYYDDMYNIFHNPSYVNDFKNWVIIEKGVTNATAAGTGNVEGGFVTSMMGMNFGFFMNREDAFSLSRLTLTPGTGNTGVRPIDFVIGGDHGVKWGLGMTYASQKGDVGAAAPRNTNDRQLAVNAGIQVADFAPFINYRVTGKSTAIATGDETKTSDYAIGVKYMYGEFTPYAAYRKAFQKTGSTMNSSDKAYIVGVGRNSKLGENARLVYNVSFGQQTDKNNAAAGDAKQTVIPVDFALEADVASWITVRGGLQYRLMDKVTGSGAGTSAGSQDDATTGRIGATFHINKVDLDWALGQGVAAANSLDSSSAGFDGGTFTNLSLAYRW
jgi:hypothetical protein